MRPAGPAVMGPTLQGGSGTRKQWQADEDLGGDSTEGGCGQSEDKVLKETLGGSDTDQTARSR